MIQIPVGYRFVVALAVSGACCLMAGGAAAQQPAESPQAAPPPEAKPAEAPPAPAKTPADVDSLRFDFRDVPLDTVLNYLSEVGGFTVVREATPEGRVDVISRQPLNRSEAVALLNAILSNKGYAAIRDDRTLTILKSEDAKQRNIPVKSGSDPEAIPKNSEMVTQVIPVRHTDATQLLENLKPLLPSYAVANANQSSNAIVLTDTQANVKRMAEIIQALDKSISAISEVRVFVLNYAGAVETAAMINALFQTPATPSQPTNPQRGPGRRGGGPPQAAAPKESAAVLAAAKVQAVADERTNSVIVCASSDVLESIAEMLAELDKEGMPTADMKVFPLEHADAGEMAQIINDAFSQAALGGGTTAGGRTPGRTASAARPGQAARPGTTGNLAHAVADFRTNSIVVVAEIETMEQVARMIEKLESNPARQQKVYVYKLKNADVTEVATVLQGMFAQTGATASRTTRSATTSTRSTTPSSSSNRRPSTGSSTRRSTAR